MQNHKQRTATGRTNQPASRLPRHHNGAVLAPAGQTRSNSSGTIATRGSSGCGAAHVAVGDKHERLLAKLATLSEISAVEEDAQTYVEQATLDLSASVFENYGTQAQSDDSSTSRTKQHIEDLQRGLVTCLICIEATKRDAAVWQCEQCYALFHLGCIQSWVLNGVKTRAKLSRELFPLQDSPKWHCPKCRFDYLPARAPSQYLCFCTKEVDPPFDPWITPHSCGQLCGKRVSMDCSHVCVLRCHPGPCPPCPHTVTASCFCGQRSSSRRCGARLFSCGDRCAKTLQCGKHVCAELCHDGPCGVCTQTTLQTCLCGRLSSPQLCSAQTFRCDQVCGKLLSCGHHVCKEVCHAQVNVVSRRQGSQGPS
eukprot:GILK01026726.1.p1 GENE.GILK01026726.1~~GILK01026726.1.p1  ORF type:complete len:367 (+),score=11.45 GILK01026726.1:36-1136(+)